MTSDGEEFSNLIESVPDLKFRALEPGVWDTIGYEGLDEEKGKMRKSQWRMADLKIPKADSQGLYDGDGDTIDRYALFDAMLKERYKMKYIDLINYDTGRVVIVKTV